MLTPSATPGRVVHARQAAFVIAHQGKICELLYAQATEDKNNAIAQAEKTATKAKLADRLINGLSGENKRWNETIAKFGVAEGKLNGIACVACCVSLDSYTLGGQGVTGTAELLHASNGTPGKMLMFVSSSTCNMYHKRGGQQAFSSITD